ncbi:VOC family protein [Bacillus rubiinfantis]|uniref:VOC family protein n=1 Tax=Bacillus rubiinfantis TaxID=1499680 RepID=UPI0005A96717|nr:VOC family protein [Bacillus rubiinfantis]
MNHFHQKPTVYVSDVTIKVKNFNASVKFYQKILGFQVLEQTAQKAVLTADGSTPLLTLEQPINVIAKEPRTTGLYHFAILLPSRADFARFLRHILKTGYPLGAADHLVSEALYLNDPDGNGIEVYRDRPAAEWQWKNGLVEMATDPLDSEGILSECDEAWTGLPEGTVMGHIHLHVADLQAAQEFYTNGLGFEVVSYYPQAVFLSTSGYHHHIAINTWQGIGAKQPADNSVGLASYTIVYHDADGRETVITKLKQLGAPIQEQGDDYLTSDPSGNRIRLVI